MSPIILLSVYTLLSCVAGWFTDRCFVKWKRTADRAGRIRKYWLIPYILLSLLPVAGAFLPNGAVKFALQAAGNVWLGFYLYYGALLLLLFLIAAIVRLVSARRAGKAWHGAILVLSCVTAAALVGYGLIHAQDTKVKRIDIQLEKPAGDMDSMKLVLLGDLHLSVNSRLSTIQRMVELVNAEEADVVVVAGDIFTSSYAGLSDPDAYAEALRGIQARYGVYAVYGNHDVEETLFGGFPISPISQAFRSPEMEAFVEKCGFEMLTDEVVWLNDAVQLAGRLDGEKAGDGTKNRLTEEELLANADSSAPIIVLQHEPKRFEALKKAGADVALCGHTHAGQLFPGNLVIPLFNENAWGYARVHDLDTVVTAGVGYYGPPMRVGTDSEITVIHFTFQSGES